MLLLVLAPALAQSSPSVGPTSAPAEPPWAATLKADAREHLDRALNYYSTADYHSAADEFKAAFRLDPNPQLLYALGQAERLGNDCQTAIDVYRAFLRTNPNDRQAALAQKNIDECQAALSAHLAPPIEPLAGNGSPPASQAAPALEGQALSPAPSPPSPWYKDTLGLTVSGGGLVLAILGGVAFLEANNITSSAQGESFQQFQAAQASASSWRTIGIVTEVAGGLAIAGGAYRFYIVRRRDRTARADLTAAIRLSPGGLSLAGSF